MKRLFFAFGIFGLCIIPGLPAVNAQDTLQKFETPVPTDSTATDTHVADPAATESPIPMNEFPTPVPEPAVQVPDSSLLPTAERTETATSADTPAADTTESVLEQMGVDTVGKVEIGCVSDQKQDVLTGSVLSPDGVTPVIGATVSWVSHKTSIQTDVEGKFTLPYHTEDTLRISAIGFSTKIVPLQAGSNDLTIVLGLSNKTVVDEVVVTAMGIERDTRTLSYDVQQLDGSKVNTVKDGSGNVMSSLNGKVAGLATTQASGGPGSPVKVILRGYRSISGNNNALIVVDGAPIDNTLTGTQATDENGGYTGSDGAVNINPDDIQSISVLKGQSAAALYGGKAANGAIVITTKRGHAGPLEVHYNGGFSVQVPKFLMNYQNTYGRGNGGVYSATSGYSWGEKSKTYPDNVRSFFHNGYTIDNSINISGGSQTFQGYASYTNNAARGIIGNNDLMAHTLNARVTAKFLQRLTTDLKVTYVSQQVNNRVKTGEIGTAINAYIMPRDMSIDELNHFEDYNEYGQPVPAPWPTPNPSIYTNPYWHVNRTSYDTRRDRTILLGSAKYSFTDWLNLQARYNVDFYTDRVTGKFYDKSIILAPLSGGQYYEYTTQRANQYFDVLLSGENRFLRDFSVDYNIGASFQNVKAQSVNATANGLNIPNLFTLKNGSAPAVTSGYSEVLRQGVFATAQIGYKNFLYADGSIRNDWSSTLVKPYRFLYPSVGLTAILSEALHLPNWVTFGKVRGTYAFVGNDARAFIIHQYYTFSPGSGNGFISRDAARAIENLKPEQTRSFEFGTDWSFFDDRLGAHLTVYKSNSYNQLLSLAMVPATGFSSRWVNAGNVENTGFEIQAYGRPIRTNDLSWLTTVNFSKNNNRIISLLPELKESKLSNSERLGIIGIREGERYGDVYGYVWEKDAQGRHIVDEKGLPVVKADQKLGNFSPDFMVAWRNDFRYKNFTLSFQIDGRVGGVAISGTDAYLAYYGLADYTEAFRSGGLILQGVHEDGSPNTTAVDAETFWTTVSQAGRAAWAEFFTYDATNFRLRELSLGYTFHVDKPYLKSVKLSLVGSNLFFFYRGKAILDIEGMPDRKIPFDPEMSLGAANSQGLESGMPPSTRGFGVNLKLNF